jgi:hypothetical protein
MSLWYGGVSTDARMAARGSDRRSALCVAHVRRGGETTRTRLTTRHVGVRVPRDALGTLGSRAVRGTDAEAWAHGRGRGRGVATRHRGAGRGQPKFGFADPRFEHSLLQNFE